MEIKDTLRGEKGLKKPRCHYCTNLLAALKREGGRIEHGGGWRRRGREERGKQKISEKRREAKNAER